MKFHSPSNGSWAVACNKSLPTTVPLLFHELEIVSLPPGQRTAGIQNPFQTGLAKSHV